MDIANPRIEGKERQIASVGGPRLVICGGHVQARRYDLWTYGRNCSEVLPQVQEHNWLDPTTSIAFTNSGGGGFPGTELARNRQ
jgi:hypothetical protein